MRFNLEVGVQLKIDEVSSKIAEYKGKITSLPKSAQDIMNIQRELDVNTKMYLFLLEKKTNTLITRAGIIPQVRVIENPRSIGVVRPDKSRIKVTSVLIGLIAALFIALVRTVFFERIENVKELVESTSLSVIGGVPFVDKHVNLSIVARENPKSQIAESFRTIRTNLTFLGIGGSNSKVILISSFFPGEGKTFVSTNLASIISSADKKVLVIDFDLHKPKIHKMFEVKNDFGVTTCLIGKTEINETSVNLFQENLHILTAGPIAPNPSELILKSKVEEIIAWARENYDFVILDTPPFGLLNDSIALSIHADIFLVVANTKVLKKRGISVVEEILTKVGSREKGIILNGVKQRRLSYYYSKYVYKYNYGYSYGYGYGGSYQEKDGFE